MIITSPTPEQARLAEESLCQVIDPEIGLNIVDLGLVYRVDFEEADKCISVEMTLTSQFCPMGEAITDSAADVMREAFPDYTTEITIVFEPRWGHHLITEAGLEFLNS
jgi:metal-sulfur cluster biosynthetic enzyme